MDLVLNYSLKTSNKEWGSSRRRESDNPLLSESLWCLLNPADFTVVCDGDTSLQSSFTNHNCVYVNCHTFKMSSERKPVSHKCIHVIDRSVRMYVTYIYIYLVFKQTLSLLFHLSNTSQIKVTVGLWILWLVEPGSNNQYTRHSLLSLFIVQCSLLSCREENKTRNRCSFNFHFGAEVDLYDLYGKSIFVKSGMSGKEGDPI